MLEVEWLLVLATLALIWLQPAAGSPPRALRRVLIAHVLSQLVAVLVVAWLLQAPWVLIALLLMAERQVRVWRTPPGSDARERHAIEAGVAFGLFLIAVFVALMLPRLQLGLPDSLWIEIERLGLGLHVDEVQPALGLGLLYFCSSAGRRSGGCRRRGRVAVKQAEHPRTVPLRPGHARARFATSPRRIPRRRNPRSG